MTITTQPPADLLGIDNPEQYKDRAGTPEPKSPFVSDDEKVTRSESALSSDDTRFKPNKIYYIQGHFMASKEIRIIDITGQVPITFVDGEQEGKNVSEDFRDAAKKVGDGKDKSQAWVFRKKHWYNKSYQAFRGDDSNTALGEWKHPTWSTGTATIDFPVGSKHCAHSLSVAPLKWTRRTNEFVVESVPFAWKFDDKYKSSRLTLSKKIGGAQSTVGRYSQKWSAWCTINPARVNDVHVLSLTINSRGLGGVILLDDREVDDLVALLTCCVMLRRIEQRRWERSGSVHGGGS